ncbi:ZPR1 zinc-finger domain protein [Striga asiatica]|uniref:ZPR1 zinc-finger domain protein n=1 Tax=Striga asiatica TaxID=4170 RepID=A0A5A7PXA4_STRAF|nr:ZPR1 zinc-finger domain protein [Striga asiatica]
MVSDASSGPRPNINEDHCSSFSGSKKSSNRKNKTTEDEKHSQFCLDDTATSHFLHFYQASPNQNHYSSVEHFEREPSPKKHLGYAKSPTKGKSGGVRGRKRQ